MINSRVLLFKEKQEQKEDKETLIIPLGMLQEIDQNLTAGAFIRLSQSTLTIENRLTPAKIKELMPQILQADEKLMIGKLTADEFRKEMRAILKLNDSVTDEQFDQAWNAMLGDVNKLFDRLKQLQTLNKEIILISKTNPIHMQRILSAKTLKNPLELMLFPLFVSYHCSEYKSAITLYQEAMKTQVLKSDKTTLVLQSVSTSPFTKNRDEDIANQIMAWANSLGIKVYDREPAEDIFKMLDRYETQKIKVMSKT